MRTIGVEEEMLLVDVRTGRPRAVSARLLRDVVSPPSPAGVGLAVVGALEGEFQRQMIEFHTSPIADLADLDAEVRRWRSEAIAAARHADTSVAALAVSPQPVTPVPAVSTRYQWILDRYQDVARKHLVCGMHIHVSVDSDDEGVGVLDRIRVWLPVLLALSANSPFHQGEDTGFASYRQQMLARWPSVGPTEVLGSVEAYRALVDDMVHSPAVLDEAMVYFDARLSHHYPTVEIRVGDVCQRSADTVLLAGLARGLVETAAREWAAGEPAPDVSATMLRLASWQASREGMSGSLLDPRTQRPRPAWAVVDDLVEHLSSAVEAAGDTRVVADGMRRIRDHGTGAELQRRTLDRTGNLIDVVAQAVRLTAGQDEDGESR